MGLAVACAGCGLLNDATGNDGKEDSVPLSDTQSTEQSSSTTTVPQTSEEAPVKRVWLADRYLDEVEAAYESDSQLPEYESTAGMCELNDKYANRWKEIADEYYDKLMAFRYDYEDDFPEHYCHAEDFHTALANMKAAHEEYAKKDYDSYVTITEYVYQTGSIRGPILSNHQYKAEKEWALKILDICDMMGIE